MLKNILYFSLFQLIFFSLLVSQEFSQKKTNTIKFGMSTALSGPAKGLGQNMRDGVLAAFHEINLKDGVQGKAIELIVIDDGYEPDRTIPNMRRLTGDSEILGIIGNVGTPTAVTAIPIANKNKILFFGAYTGAGILRKTPPDKYVINFRGSYAEETASMVDALIRYGDLKPNEIAFFTQRDAYGDAGYIGGINALKKNGLKSEALILHGRYNRNTNVIEEGLAEIIRGDIEPKAIILVGAYAPCAEFIKQAKGIGLNPIFLNVSFVGTIPLKEALEDKGEGVIITQVVPHFNSQLKIVKEYHNALKYKPKLKPNFGSLEGYVSAKILIKALQKSDIKFRREDIVTALESLGSFDIGLGANLDLSRNEHQACHSIWPTIIHEGKVEKLDWKELKNIFPQLKNDNK